MSETSVKIPIKKGFKAPILKGSTQEKKSESKEDKFTSKPLKMLKKQHEDKNESEEGEAVPQKQKKIIKQHKGSKEFGKDEISAKKEKKVKKPEISLTDSQYEDLFKAVLQGPNSLQHTPIEQLLEVVAKSSEKSSVKEYEEKTLTESDGSVKTSVSLKERNLSELSPWGSHLSKQNSQASSILKELQANTLLSPASTSCSENSDEEVEADVVLSQTSVRQLSQRSYTDTPTPKPTLKATARPRKPKVDKRLVLEKLQTKRNVGLWVFCDRMTCKKQRYLPHVTDPQELPDIWYCHMNPDPRYNSCSCEEQQPSPEEEEDMIDNQFTCGSVVWAQVTGFPWWPAMVDDDPDLEWYYWLDEDMRTVTFYHVVFFDKNEVTRAWIPINKIVSFKKNLNNFGQRVVRGIDFTPRLRVAREQAEEAVSMTVVQRLKKFSFIARYKGPIFDDQTQIEKTKSQYKFKCLIGKKGTAKKSLKRRAETNDENLTLFETVAKSNMSIKSGKQRKLFEEKVERKSIADDDENDSNTFIEISKAAEKHLSKELNTTRSDSLSTQTKDDLSISKKTSDGELTLVGDKENKNPNPKTNLIGDKVTQNNKNSHVSETPTVGNIENIKSGEETNEGYTQKTGSGSPSVIESSMSQKSKTSRRSVINTTEGCVEPSQAGDSSNKLSQSTIADFLAAESEDAVVPEANFSQQSEPFEE